MKNVMGPIATSWFTLLSEQLTYGAKEVHVYPTDADSSDDFHYVLIEKESEADDSNKSQFVTRPIIRLRIVTVHSVNVTTGIVDEIDDQIRELAFPNRKCNLPTIEGLQVTTIKFESSSYIRGDDGSKKYYEKVIRVSHRVTQI